MSEWTDYEERCNIASRTPGWLESTHSLKALYDEDTLAYAAWYIKRTKHLEETL